MPDLDERMKQLNTELETLKQNSDLQKIWDLEKRVKEVMQDASGSPQQEQAQDLLSAVISLRQQVTKLSDMSERLTQVRAQIYAVATSEALSNAVGTLLKVLTDDPENIEARVLVGELWAKHPDFAVNSRRVLPVQPPSGSVAELIKPMTEMYYGEENYVEVIHLCNEILIIDPYNVTALQFLHKADENIERGRKSDNRIPQTARDAYNRGLTAKNSELYAEAQVLFATAVETAQSFGIDWWHEPKNELREIDLRLSEKKLVGEADELVKQDSWNEAIAKYQHALDLKQISRTKVKYDLLDALLRVHRAKEDGKTLYDSYLKGVDSSMIAAIEHLYQQMLTARQHWSGSEQLKDLWKWVQEEFLSIGMILWKEGEEKLDEASKSTTIKEYIRRIDEALAQLETARAWLPENSELDGLLRTARNAKNRMVDNQTLIKDNDTTMEGCSVFEVGARSPQITNVLVKLKNRSDLVVYDEYRDLLTRVIEELLRCGGQAITQGNLQQAEQHFREAENAYKVIFFSVDQGPVVEGDEEIRQRRDAVKSLKERLRNLIKFRFAECSGTRQQYKDAISLLEELLKEDPSGKIDYELSIARYQKLDQLQSNEQDGKRYYRAKNWEKAVEFLKKALDSGSTDLEVEKFYERANKQLNRQLNGWATLTFSEKIKLIVPILVFIMLWILTGFLIAANVLH